ncbi:hypothetical protein AAFF_G00174000 [Aldrovandia affinis]|uniref:Uncharacterized protein n=1 Tax=Aldrovandia affinis TaxID=143900 RepID=A0AAD7SZ23_9TELE|nr:hypothetical protein AAFF_G00174000 [Aldrovandia affinis]
MSPSRSGHLILLYPGVSGDWLERCPGVCHLPGWPSRYRSVAVTGSAAESDNREMGKCVWARQSVGELVHQRQRSAEGPQARRDGTGRGGARDGERDAYLYSSPERSRTSHTGRMRPPATCAALTPPVTMELQICPELFIKTPQVVNNSSPRTHEGGREETGPSRRC